MRIGCLQFAPQVGDVDNNLNRADAVLTRANPQDLDLLVLPELAFSGYNFKSLQHIDPFLEPTASGISSLWARTVALKYDCVVTVGYPEKAENRFAWPASPEYYNSAITVDGNGNTIANYRKSVLYYTDETWALDGPDSFYDGEIARNVAMGSFKWPTKTSERIDLHPYRFEAPWNIWDFAYHVIYKEANLVVISLAWLTLDTTPTYSQLRKEPDMVTLSYWLNRLEPVIRAEREGEIIVVLANRCGTEGDAMYAGSSTVLGLQAGEVKVYGILGRGEKELLVVDTDLPPEAKLVSHSAKEIFNPFRDSLAPVPTESSIDQASSIFSINPRSSSASSLSLDIHTPKPRSLSTRHASLDEIEFSIDDIITPVSAILQAETARAFVLPSDDHEEVSESSEESISPCSILEQSPETMIPETLQASELKEDSSILSLRGVVEGQILSTEELLECKRLFQLTADDAELQESTILVESPSSKESLITIPNTEARNDPASTELPASPTPTTSYLQNRMERLHSPAISPGRSPSPKFTDPCANGIPTPERPSSPKIRNCSRDRHSSGSNPDSGAKQPLQAASSTSSPFGVVRKTISTSAIVNQHTPSSGSPLENQDKQVDQGLSPRVKHRSLRRLKSTFW